MMHATSVCEARNIAQKAAEVATEQATAEHAEMVRRREEAERLEREAKARLDHQQAALHHATSEHADAAAARARAGGEVAEAKTVLCNAVATEQSATRRAAALHRRQERAARAALQARDSSDAAALRSCEELIRRFDDADGDVEEALVREGSAKAGALLARRKLRSGTAAAQRRAEGALGRWREAHAVVESKLSAATDLLAQATSAVDLCSDAVLSRVEELRGELEDRRETLTHDVAAAAEAAPPASVAAIKAVTAPVPPTAGTGNAVNTNA